MSKDLKLIKSQQLDIKSKRLSKNNLFSKLLMSESMVEDESENLTKSLSENLSFKLKLTDDDQKVDKKIERKKAIKDNIFAIRNHLSKIKESPSKIKEPLKINDSSTYIRNQLPGDESTFEMSKLKKIYSPDVVNSCPNPFHLANLIPGKSRNLKLTSFRNFSNDNQKNSNGSLINSSRKKNPPKLKTLKTNHDLYAETIAKQLKSSDSNLIKFIIDTIGPNLAFKMSSKVFNDKSTKSLEDLEDEEEDDFDPIDKFLELIQKEKSISTNTKQVILDFKFKHCSNKMGKRKKRRIKKTVDTIQSGLDNLYLSLDTLSSAINDDGKKVVKRIDFK